MNPKKLTVDELTRLAFIHADADVSSLLDAYSDCQDDPHWADTIARNKTLLKQLRAYRRKRWGLSNNDKLDSIPVLPLNEFLKRKDS